jgi:hypothetical protein
VATIHIEPEPPIKERRCEACGGTNRLLHGYVYEDERPHGVYFVEWCDGEHPEKAAFLTMGLGAFGDDTDRHDRAAFCVEWRKGGMHLTEEPARGRPDLLGDFVPRSEALPMPEHRSSLARRGSHRPRRFALGCRPGVARASLAPAFGATAIACPSVRECPRAFSGTYQRKNAAADIAKAMSARFRQTASGAKARVLVDGFRRQTRTPA